MKKYIKIFSSFLLLLFGVLENSMAQCAMCRATIENNVSSGDTTIGAGLNMGILYLFLAPYVLLSVLGFFWYRNVKRKKKIIY
ncbi:MAG: hypothetical protein WDZ72_01650 [Cyclobacteriaceae bacterium]